MKQVKVFAHGGASGYAPENTLPAFALAMEQGADGIELDVHLSRDGELVVIHDEKLERTTDGSGLDCEHSLAELRALHAANGMDGFPEARIPTLREVLALVKPSAMQVNIELKTGILWYEGIEGKTLRLVDEMGMADRMVYSSFNHYSVEAVRRLAPEAETAWLFSDVICDVEKLALARGVKGLHPALWHTRMADLLERYLGSGGPGRLWTVLRAEVFRRLRARGGVAVITNVPALALSVRREPGE